MTTYTTSPDGTTIAWEQFGAGPPMLLVGGLLCDRARTRDLARALSSAMPGHSVINYDRRGRGESTETGPYAVEREIDDLMALAASATQDAPGGQLIGYGHSSGAGLLLRAAAAGLPVTRLVLHEPPYATPDGVAAARELAEAVRDAVTAGRPADAIRAFMADSDMPEAMIEEMATDPATLRLAATMPYDHDVMGDYDRGGAVPDDVVAAVTVPTLVIVGSSSSDDFRVPATMLAKKLPAGELATLHVEHHQPENAATAVAAFLTG